MIPSSIKIGAYTFAVVRLPDAEMPDDDGSCDLASLRICLAASSPEERLRVVLLHEIMHALWWAASLPARAGEETAVNALSQGLVAVLRDNPGLEL